MLYCGSYLTKLYIDIKIDNSDNNNKFTSSFEIKSLKNIDRNLIKCGMNRKIKTVLFKYAIIY